MLTDLAKVEKEIFLGDKDAVREEMERGKRDEKLMGERQTYLRKSSGSLFEIANQLIDFNSLLQFHSVQ